MSPLKNKYFDLKLVVTYILILVAGSWVSYAVFQTARSIALVSQKLTNEQLPNLNYIADLKHWMSEYERGLYELYATSDRVVMNKKLQLAQENIELNLQHLSNAFSNKTEIIKVAELYQQSKTHAQLLDEALPPAPYDWDSARNELVLISQLGHDILPYLNHLSAFIKQQIENSKQRSNEQLISMTYWVAAFSLLILVVAVLVGYYVRRSILQAKETQRLALFVEKNPNPVACLNFDTQMQFKNFAWQTRYDEQQSLELTNQIKPQLAKLLETDDEFVILNLQYQHAYLEISLHKIKSLHQFMVYVEDATERETSRNALEFLAYHDPLTGLPNLKKLEDDIDNFVRSELKDPFIIFSIGIKKLHFITSTHGYSVSDAVIVGIANRIEQCIKQLKLLFATCNLFRFSGAKFELMIAEPTDGNDLYQSVGLFEQLFNEIKQSAIDTRYGQFFIDLQVGCVMYPEHGEDSQILMRNANAALLEAQNKSSQVINIFDLELAFKEQQWFQLETDMRQANFDNEFYLNYQPKINLIDGKLVGVEALVRWNHPHNGFISPIDFISIAEESGHILLLGDWIMRAALKQVSQWKSQGLDDLQVAVNVSPSQLVATGFFERVMACLHENNLTTKHLEIEITEQVMMDDKQRCVDILTKLKKVGISIAIDDFGTGYSSLSYLNQLPISKLKIDRAFVTSIQTNASNLAIVKTILGLANNLNLLVIAEGVETEQEANVLKGLGCQQGQGYYYARPLSVEQFTQSYIHLT